MRKLLAAGLVSAALLVVGCAVALSLGGDESPEVLPDLDQAVPDGLTVGEAAGRQRLGFLSAVDNAGAGALVVEGSRRPNEATMSVRQIVRREDGSTSEVTVPAEIRFVRSETHRHWHLLGFERYELRRPGGELVSPDVKTGFCLGDRYDSEAAEPPQQPAEPVWTRECGRGQPRLLEISQGISPGYGDDYVANLEGQYVDITDAAPGRYVLVHRVNPERVLRESDYENNAASVLIHLSRRDEGLPRVRVLAACAETDGCR